jgi:hypothetical protein
MFSPFAQDRGRGGWPYCLCFAPKSNERTSARIGLLGNCFRAAKTYRVLWVPLRAKRSSSVRVNMLRFPTRTVLSDFLKIKSSNLRKEIPSASAASARANRSFRISTIQNQSGLQSGVQTSEVHPCSRGVMQLYCSRLH